MKDRNASAQASGTYQADTPNVYGNPTNAATTYPHYAAGVQVTGSPELPVSQEQIFFDDKAKFIPLVPSLQRSKVHRRGEQCVLSKIDIHICAEYGLQH